MTFPRAQGYNKPMILPERGMPVPRSSPTARAADAAANLFAPTHVRTNQNTTLIKLLACVFMVIDHAGKMLFPDVPELRYIGRLAFPLFAYCIAVGAVFTRNPLRYLSRIAALALVSQPLYALALGHESSAMFAVSFVQSPLRAAWSFYIGSWQKPSILLSLLLGLALLCCLRRRQPVLAATVLVLCARFSSNLDYGLNGVLLMLLFYLLCPCPPLSLAATCAFLLFHWAQGFGYFLLEHEFNMEIFALPAILFVHLPMRKQLHIPRWLLYAFYPAHLAVLAVLVRLLPA